ncbi:hypothetical protein FQA47_003164 [Oryzias melastigma]|uniref:Uncharacterized protein n=1 Tax=Oryzias melastigma TaxID=30732 RepID=A0A834CEH1_ORYME|nr:hypothetical protein FQA47_003164 [Oryzias melastigma]
MQNRVLLPPAQGFPPRVRSGEPSEGAVQVLKRARRRLSNPLRSEERPTNSSRSSQNIDVPETETDSSP